MRLLPAAFKQGLPCAVAGLVLTSALTAGVSAQSRKQTAPEVFNARASVGAAAGRGDAYVTIRVDHYSAKNDLDKLHDALKNGGSAAFVQALKGSPIAGRFEVGSRTVSIRYAKEVPSDKGRTITLVLDSPVYFIGGGVPGAKPREGFDVAVVQLDMDSSGVGEGRMAVAAKVKPGQDAADIDAYEGEPIKLLSVMRKIS
jgi:hypothetical protein